jgi:hypothetical protein
MRAMTTPIYNRLAIPQKPRSWRDNAFPLLLGLAFGMLMIGFTLLFAWYMFASGTPTPGSQ